MGVAAAKAVKPANPSPHAAAEEEKESVKPEKPKEPDVEYTMDSEPDLADEPDDDNLDMPNAADDPEKLAEPVAFRMLLQVTNEGKKLGTKICLIKGITPIYIKCVKEHRCPHT